MVSPIVYFSYEQAEKAGRIDAYNESMYHNACCAMEIVRMFSRTADVIPDNLYGAIIAKYGYDRPMWVLAAEIRRRAEAGQVSELLPWAVRICDIPLEETTDYEILLPMAMVETIAEHVKAIYDQLEMLEPEDCIAAWNPRDRVSVLAVKARWLSQDYKRPKFQYIRVLRYFPKRESVMVRFLADKDEQEINVSDIMGKVKQVPEWIR